MEARLASSSSFRAPRAGAAPGVARNFEDLRFRGWKGGLITPHRAFASIRPTLADAIGSIVLLVGMSLAWVAMLDRIGRFWGAIFTFWAAKLHLGANVVMVPHSWGTHIHFALPYISVPAGPVSPLAWSLTAVITAGVLAATFFLNEEHLAWVYIARALVIIQTSALVYFAFFSARFPHDLPGYTVSMLTFGVILIGLVPVILALTFYVFDLPFTRKLVLTLLAIGHLTLFIPLQYVLHVYILQHSILFMPVLYFAFGPFLDVLVFVALYSWGMSWRSRSDLRSA
jgi:hypothetical protein